jgi:hypothetical protein
MVNEKLIVPKENIYKTEEVRELENKDLAQQSEQQQKKSEEKPTITENVKETILPVAHASDDEEMKAATSGVGGGILAGATFTPLAPFAQFMAAGETVLGKGVEKLGEATGNEDMKEGGRVSKEMGEIGSLPSIAKGGKAAIEKAATGGK